MSLKLQPIKYEELFRTQSVWVPFVLQIAERQHCWLEQRLAEIYAGKISLIAIINEEEKSIQAILGYSLLNEGKWKRLKLVMLAGEDRREFLPLYETVEGWARSAGCVGMAADVRPGWISFLKSKGYKFTHATYEKDFDAPRSVEDAKLNDDVGDRPVEHDAAGELNKRPNGSGG